MAGDAERVAEDRRAVESLRADVEAVSARIARLDARAAVFQARKCRACALELDLPSVHFLCGEEGDEHSFHQACTEGVCPVCAGEQRTVRGIHDALLGARRGAADAFFRELRASDDKFGKAVEWLGKGLDFAGPADE